MSGRIRVGVIGATTHHNWSSISHLPAIHNSTDFELSAVCTTRMESAEAARQAFGARLAFDDYEKMIASPDVDAVAVAVRVPSHYATARAALEAGKHVYCEWPLGRTTAEAVELANLARNKRVVTAVGLQARVNPGIRLVRELLASEALGSPLTVHVSMMRHGALRRNSSHTWQRDVDMGANALTILNGHSLDTLRYVAGEFAGLQAALRTQTKQWYETDTDRTVDVTSPDTVIVNGDLVSGAVASSRVGLVPFAGSGFLMEVYCREGTLEIKGTDSPQLCDVAVRITRGGNDLEPVAVPPHPALETRPDANTGKAVNVGNMYASFARAIRSGDGCHPTFDTAVELHRLLDFIRMASESDGRVRCRVAASTAADSK